MWILWWGDLRYIPFKIDCDGRPLYTGRARKWCSRGHGHGPFDEYIVENLKGLDDAVLLESNHDVRRCWRQALSHPLKRRILGDHGHLSNENAGRLLNRILH